MSELAENRIERDAYRACQEAQRLYIAGCLTAQQAARCADYCQAYADLCFDHAANEARQDYAVAFGFWQGVGASWKALAGGGETENAAV